MHSISEIDRSRETFFQFNQKRLQERKRRRLCRRIFFFFFSSRPDSQVRRGLKIEKKGRTDEREIANAVESLIHTSDGRKPTECEVRRRTFHSLGETRSNCYSIEGKREFSRSRTFIFRRLVKGPFDGGGKNAWNSRHRIVDKKDFFR